MVGFVCAQGMAITMVRYRSGMSHPTVKEHLRERSFQPSDHVHSQGSIAFIRYHVIDIYIGEYC